MRRPLLAGNWKMNTNRVEAEELVKRLLPIAKDCPWADIVIAAPYVHLNLISKIISDSDIKLAAQNMFWEDKGAYTGEISPLMLKDYGCSYVIIGHSERRAHFREDDEMINKKVRSAFKHKLIPILCVGETLQQRREGKAWDVIKNQIEKGIEGIKGEDLSMLIIAYEPVWAIGTGVAAEAKDAIEIHNLIRNYFNIAYSISLGDNVRILYGGSVTSANIDSFMKEETIDGALVGGASLKFDEFYAIIRASRLKVC